MRSVVYDVLCVVELPSPCTPLIGLKWLRVCLHTVCVFIAWVSFAPVTVRWHPDRRWPRCELNIWSAKRVLLIHVPIVKDRHNVYKLSALRLALCSETCICSAHHSFKYEISAPYAVHLQASPQSHRQVPVYRFRTPARQGADPSETEK